MNIVTTPESVLQIATQAMARTPDPRLRTVMTALTRHLHAFVQAVKLTEDEFERALEFLVAIGQASGETKNEVVLAADLLGVSTLVALLNNQDPQGESPAALLGPFWRANAPACDAGESIARSETPGTSSSRSPDAVSCAHSRRRTTSSPRRLVSTGVPNSASSSSSGKPIASSPR